jgi:serine-type D-Ala-D-Ala carboxypeptidase (penicillin-binding protein 5/6)
MRRSRARRGRVLLPVVLVAALAVVLTLTLTGGSSDTAVPPRAAINGPPALKHRARELKPSKQAPPPGIDLFGAQPLRVHFKHPPRAGLLFDLRSGQVLWARRPLKPLPIASTTKIMTAILTVERTRAGDMTRVTRQALHYTGSGVGVLPRHRRVPVDGLLAGMLLPSGNDAALALAGHISGSNRRFARLMNRRARAMGLGCTHYVSADGIERRNRSCAADLAALARVAMSKPRIARLVRRKQARPRFPVKGGHLWLNSTNPLLHLGYRGTIGLKTGFTDPAGHCFVGVARRGSRTYGVVLLHSPDTGLQARKLLDAAFRRR